MLTSETFKHAFSYPFKDPAWFKKIAVGSVLMIVAGIIQYFAYSFWDDLPTLAAICWGISLIPLIHVDGYIYWLFQDCLQNYAEAELPDWDDWRDMFYTGLRLRVVELIYTLPILACSLIIVNNVSSNLLDQADLATAGTLSTQNWSILINTLLNIGIFSSLSMFFSLIYLVMMPPTIAHMVAKDNLKSAFDLQRIWIVFEQNPWNFLLPAFMGQALLIISSVVYFLIFAVCFLVGIVILSGITNFYFRLVTTNLYGKAYFFNARPAQERQDNVNEH